MGSLPYVYFGEKRKKGTGHAERGCRREFEGGMEEKGVKKWRTSSSLRGELWET